MRYWLAIALFVTSFSNAYADDGQNVATPQVQVTQYQPQQPVYTQPAPQAPMVPPSDPASQGTSVTDSMKNSIMWQNF